MIVIFSFEDDLSTEVLVDWLIYYELSFEIVYLENEDFRNINIEFKCNSKYVSFTLKNGRVLNFNEVSFFVCRGGILKKGNIKNETNLTDEVFHKYIDLEFKTLTNYFYNEINKKCIGYISNDFLNKLIQLEIASEVGINIGHSIISSSKNKILERLPQNKITKAIQENIAIKTQGYIFNQRVQRVIDEEIEESFFPSFFQEEICKMYELRIFYLDKTCYAIALNSRNLNSVDTREEYDNCEFEPYKLCEILEEKITNLMTKLNLFSGSLDFIKSKNGEYVFLEINPTGQFDWVSHYGGFDLYNKIAIFLKNESESEKNKFK